MLLLSSTSSPGRGPWSETLTLAGGSGMDTEFLETTLSVGSKSPTIPPLRVYSKGVTWP